MKGKWPITTAQKWAEYQVSYVDKTCTQYIWDIHFLFPTNSSIKMDTFYFPLVGSSEGSNHVSIFIVSFFLKFCSAFYKLLISNVR